MPTKRTIKAASSNATTRGSAKSKAEKKREFDAFSPESVAFHEAANAVAAVHFGLSLQSVTIRPMMDRKRKVTLAGHVLILSKPPLLPSNSNLREIKAYLRSELKCVLAGPIATTYMQYQSEGDGEPSVATIHSYTSDCVRADEIGKHLKITPFQRQKIENEVVDWFNENLEIISIVAAFLQFKGTLKAMRVKSIVDGHAARLRQESA